MTIQDRIKLLREKARWHDQVSRELHASADQLEERQKIKPAFANEPTLQAAE